MQHFSRRWLAVAAAVGLALVAFVLFWFQPHKLFVDDKVDEALPTAEVDAAAADDDEMSEPMTDAPTTTTVPPEPVDLATGSFVSRDHGTIGTARVIELGRWQALPAPGGLGD